MARQEDFIGYQFSHCFFRLDDGRQHRFASVRHIFNLGDAGFASRVHSGMFAIEPGALPMIYFRWLAQFKLLILMFNLAPYLVLRLFL